MNRLAGQHAVITGGGTGIGAAIAQVLAKEGAKLTLVGRRREKLEEIAQQLHSSRAKSSDAGTDSEQRPSTPLGTNEGVAIAPADVTEREEVERAFQFAREANGPFTILVNNAGSAEAAPFAQVTADAWRRTIAVNLDGLLHCCQAALPDLQAAEHGRIVTIASTAALKGYAYSAPYVAAKHGALGLMRALAAEFARTNLTANAVCPGFTHTDLVADAVERIQAKTGRTEAEARAELARFNPQGRLIAPDEVANAVLWLCLPQSGSINGQAIAVAGGETM